MPGNNLRKLPDTPLENTISSHLIGPSSKYERFKYERLPYRSRELTQIANTPFKRTCLPNIPLDTYINRYNIIN
jgi:hypothetical protein